ncbi:MAG: 5'-methylthioadenosine/adenosylhomocysteine nucleosidase [Spirochaetaceae bacterium]|nr:5'-methylthioadenosine/adenosylhomocysteine nucleosidase [Spirochaetaceae bacterium]
MYLVLCAMKEEVSEIIEKLDVLEKYNFFGMDFYRGILCNHETIVGMTGVGKVMAAIVTQKMIDVFLPKKVIFSGIAGCLSKDIDIGDIVISADTMQHDMDASALGFKIGEIPYTGIRLIEADPEMINAAKNFKAGNSKIILGRILTGDRFIAKLEERNYLAAEMEGVAVEMEGAAAAITAKLNNIPFLIIRVISDKSDGKALDDFKKFLKKSSRLMADMVLHIFRSF